MSLEFQNRQTCLFCITWDLHHVLNLPKAGISPNAGALKKCWEDPDHVEPDH